MDVGSFGTHAERRQFEVLLCLPMAPVPLFLANGDFGTSPIFIGTLKHMWGGQTLTTIGTIR
jgi:hypothetical protein